MKIPRTPATPRIDLEIIDSKRLQMFYVATQEGTFAAVSRSLGVTPSAVSHAIKALEEDLGCSLFRRSGPHVKPTRAGAHLMPIVGELLKRMSSMREELIVLEGRLEQLRFGIAPNLKGLLKTTVLSTFLECFPAAKVEISTVNDETQHDGKNLDFVIGYAEKAPSDVVRREIVDEVVGAYVAPFHILGNTTRVSFSELRQRLLIFPDQAIRDLIVNKVLHGSEPLAGTWILPDLESVKDLAMQGRGVAFLPSWMAAKAIGEGNLIRLKISGHELRRSCSAWWLPTSPLPWIAEVFLSLLSAEFDTPQE